MPQAPQLDESLEVSTQDEPHWASPTAHADWQAPLEQTRPALQAWPHEPQLPGSPSSSTHWLPQAVCPAGHVTAGGKPQEPCWQV